MADRRTGSEPRSSIAAHFDAMTLALVVVFAAVAMCSVLAIGPAEALDRIGCGLNDAVNVFLAYPQPCH